MRLIDADKLFDVVETYKDEMCDEPQVAHHILNLICKAPTVAKWHYPSKKEYPIEGEEVLFRCNGQNYLGTYSKISNYFDSRDMGCPASCVDCWQYIIPPEEIKNDTL